MHTKCRYRRSGTHFVGQELRCWVSQQQNWSGWNSTCSQILPRVLEFQIRIHQTIGQQNWRTYGANTDLSENSIWQPRSAIHLARFTRCFCSWHQEACSEVSERAKSRILLMREPYSCVCSTTLNGQREATQKPVCTVPKKWQHLRHNLSQDTGASSGPRQKIRCGKEHCNQPQGTCDIVKLQMVDLFKCHTSHPIFSATEPISLGQLRKGKRN